MPDILASSHDLVAVHLLQPLYHLKRLIRSEHRAAFLAYRTGLRFRRDTLRWSEKQKRDWMLERLRSAVRAAHADVPFYREWFGRAGFDPRADFDFADYARLPVLERAEVREAGTGMVSLALPERLLRKDATGGSTGRPTEIWTGPEERGWRESGIEHFMRRIGIRKGMRMGLLWGHHLDPVGSDRLGDRLRAFAENLRWFDCLRLSPEVLRRYHAQMQSWQPQCVIAYASALGMLVEEVRRTGDRARYPIHCFVTGAEKLMPHHRAMVEEVFQCPIHERYGGRDVGLLGFQLEGLDYTIDWANVLVEPESDDPEAPILVTKLHADAMPMFRYRVGDLGRFPSDARPGHPSFLLHEVVGRTTDRIWLPDGRWFHGNSFPHLMKDYPVYEFQVHQGPDFGVTLRIVPRGPFGEQARAAILRIVETNLPGLPVSLELVDTIERTRANKLRPVVSEIDSTRLDASA